MGDGGEGAGDSDATSRAPKRARKADNRESREAHLMAPARTAVTERAASSGVSAEGTAAAETSPVASATETSSPAAPTRTLTAARANFDGVQAPDRHDGDPPRPTAASSAVPVSTQAFETVSKTTSVSETLNETTSSVRSVSTSPPAPVTSSALAPSPPSFSSPDKLSAPSAPLPGKLALIGFGVLGGVVFLAMLGMGATVWLRKRRRMRTADAEFLGKPSSYQSSSFPQGGVREKAGVTAYPNLGYAVPGRLATGNVESFREAQARAVVARKVEDPDEQEVLRSGSGPMHTHAGHFQYATGDQRAAQMGYPVVAQVMGRQRPVLASVQNAGPGIDTPRMRQVEQYNPGLVRDNPLLYGGLSDTDAIPEQAGRQWANKASSEDGSILDEWTTSDEPENGGLIYDPRYPEDNLRNSAQQAPEATPSNLSDMPDMYPNWRYPGPRSQPQIRDGAGLFGQPS